MDRMLPNILQILLHILLIFFFSGESSHPDVGRHGTSLYVAPEVRDSTGYDKKRQDISIALE